MAIFTTVSDNRAFVDWLSFRILGLIIGLVAIIEVVFVLFSQMVVTVVVLLFLSPLFVRQGSAVISCRNRYGTSVDW